MCLVSSNRLEVSKKKRTSTFLFSQSLNYYPWVDVHLEEKMATYSSILGWRIQDGWRNLIGYSPRGHKESDTTEWLHFLSFLSLMYTIRQMFVEKGFGWRNIFFINKFFEPQRKRIIRSSACTSQEHHWNNVPLKDIWQISALSIDYLKEK